MTTDAGLFMFAFSSPFGYLSSLQGPLVRKSSIKWTVTLALQYFHVFPYAGIVSSVNLAFEVHPSFFRQITLVWVIMSFSFLVSSMGYKLNSNVFFSMK